jgi:hypothetical protein
MSPVIVKTCSLTAHEPCDCKNVLPRSNEPCVVNMCSAGTPALPRTSAGDRCDTKFSLTAHEPCDCIILSFHAALSPALSNFGLLGDPWRRGPRPVPLTIASTSSWCQRLVFESPRRSQDLLQIIDRIKNPPGCFVCYAIWPICRVQYPCSLFA